MLVAVEDRLQWVYGEQTPIRELNEELIAVQ